MKKRFFLITFISIAASFFIGHSQVHYEIVEEVSDVKIEAIIKNEPQSVETEFEEKLNTLPIVADLQKLTLEEVHHTPELIKDAAELIGSIHAQAQAQPIKRASAMKFFKDCAEDNEVVRPIRAVCLKKVYKLMPEWKIATVISHEKIQESVSALAFKLP